LGINKVKCINTWKKMLLTCNITILYVIDEYRAHWIVILNALHVAAKIQF